MICTVRKLPKILTFEWDEGNLDKSYEKHGITPKEAEEVFVSEELYVKRDVVHSQMEERYIAFGKSFQGRDLFVIFTFRKDAIRIISARRMYRKEVEKYEKAKKDSQI